VPTQPSIERIFHDFQQGLSSYSTSVPELEADLNRLGTTDVADASRSWHAAVDAGQLEHGREALHKFHRRAVRIVPYDAEEAHRALAELDVVIESVPGNVHSNAVSQALFAIAREIELVRQALSPQRLAQPSTTAPMTFKDLKEIETASAADLLAAESPQQRINHVLGAASYVNSLNEMSTDGAKVRAVAALVNYLRTVPTSPLATLDYMQVILQSVAELEKAIEKASTYSLARSVDESRAVDERMTSAPTKSRASARTDRRASARDKRRASSPNVSAPRGGRARAKQAQ
jgi:hypothetical protein